MDKLLALLAKARFDEATDQGDGDIELRFAVNDGGVTDLTVLVEIDHLDSLEIKHPDGTLVDFSDIHAEYEDEDEGENEDEDDK